MQASWSAFVRQSVGGRPLSSGVSYHMNRRALVTVLSALAVVAVVLGTYVGKRSMDPSERSEAAAQLSINLADMQPGELRQFRTRRGLIFAYKPSPETWTNLRSSASASSAPIEARFNADAGVFLYLGESTDHGCELAHKPKVDLSPETAAPWHGGYRDKCHGSLFDYAGRHVSGAKELPQLKGVNVIRVQDHQETVDFRSGS